MSNIVLLIAAGVAGYVFYRLYQVLGTRTGEERPPLDLFTPPSSEAEPRMKLVQAVVEDAPEPAPVVIKKSNLKVPEDVAEALKSVLSLDPKFEAEAFLEGAKAAYEMIVEAFAKEDLAQLKNLLSAEVYENFAGAIRERKAAQRTLETILVGIDKANLLEVELKGTTAQLTVQFLAKLIHVTKDATGVLVEGDPQKILDVVDVWTFARDLKSRNPNWKLIATESIEDTFA